MSRFLVLFIGTTFVSFVSGCGGGGNSSPTSTSSSSTNTVASAPSTAASPSSASPSTTGPTGGAGDGGGEHMDMAEMMKSMQQGGEQSGPPEGQGSMEDMMKKMMAGQGGAGGETSGPPAGQGSMEDMMKKMMAGQGGAGGETSGPPAGQGSMEDMMKKMMAGQGGAGGAQGAAPGGGQNMQEMMLAMANGGGAPGGGVGGVPKARPEPKTFKEKSDYAFEDGRDSDAFQYLFAHYLSDPGGVAEQQMYWVPGLEAPRTVIRWGVAIDYSAPKDFAKAPPKIGDQPNVLPEKRGSGGQQPGFGQFPGGPGGPGIGPGIGPGGPGMAPGGPGFGGQGGAAEPVDPMGKLVYYTGDIGTRIIEELDKRRAHNNAYFGAALQQVQFELQTPSGGNAFGGAAGNPAMMMAPGGGGPGGPGIGGPGIGGPQGNAAPQAAFDSTQLIPGVVFLGMGDSPEMLKQAQAHSVDYMLFFSVKVAVVKKTGLETNNTQVSVYNVNTGKSLFKQTTALNNVSFWTAKEKNNDLLEKLIDQMFINLVDEKLVAQEMPEWQESEIFERVKQLVVGQEYSNPLPVLAEVCYYRESGQKLLPDNAYNSAVSRLIGKDNAERFINGNPEDKAKAIAKWLPPKWRPTTIGGEFKN